MTTHFNGFFRFAPDPEGGGGTDPFGETGVAVGEEPGESAFGKEDGGYEEPGVSPFGDEPAAKPVAKVENKGEPEVAQTPEAPQPGSSFTIPDDEEAVLLQAFDKEFVIETGKKFGRGGVDHLLAQAKAQIEKGEVKKVVPEEEISDEPVDKATPDDKKPKGDPLDVGEVGIKPEGIQRIKDVIGEEAYTEFMQPIVQHAEKQAAAIKNLTKGFRTLIGQLNEMDNHRIMDRFKETVLGDSEGDTGLSDAHIAARDKVLKAASAYRSQNPKSSVATAIRFGLKTIKPNQQGTNVQQAKQRAGMVGAVPARTNSGTINTGGGKSMEAVRGILNQGMKALGYTS